MSHACVTQSQADDIAVARDMVKKYDAAVSDPILAADVHRVSHYLLSSTKGCMGAVFRSYANTGLMTAKLRQEISAYQLCMLDDSFMEGPHARIGRTTRVAAKSTPAWWSASIRLGQNQAARQAADQATPGRFDFFFKRWKMLSQRNKRQYDRGVIQRIKTADFVNLVYRSGDVNLVDWSVLGMLKKSFDSDAAAKKRQKEKTSNPRVAARLCAMHSEAGMYILSAQ